MWKETERQKPVGLPWGDHGGDHGEQSNAMRLRTDEGHSWGLEILRQWCAWKRLPKQAFQKNKQQPKPTLICNTCWYLCSKCSHQEWFQVMGGPTWRWEKIDMIGCTSWYKPAPAHHSNFCRTPPILHPFLCIFKIDQKQIKEGHGKLQIFCELCGWDEAPGHRKKVYSRKEGTFIRVGDLQFFHLGAFQLVTP